LPNKIIEKIAGAPAELLERGVEASEKFAKNVGNKKPIKQMGQFWNNLGPGLTTGAADDDPSGIATYSQTGAKFGFNFLWLSVFTFPLMATVQEMCARIGIVTGRGLAGNIRKFYPKWVLYTCTILLFAANTFNIGADLGAMAQATKLLLPETSFVGLVIMFALVSLVLQIFTTYGEFAKYLKYLALILFSYILSANFIDINFKDVLHHTLIPSFHFNAEQIFLICAILGTTISPYLFFWQTSQEVEEEILGGKTTLKQRQAVTTPQQIRKMKIDVWTGMFFSNLVMFFIILTCAATLFSSGITNIKTAADAANALRPLAGEKAFLLFALGIIGTGMLAIPILAGSASYALSESFGWKHGLYYKLKQASAFYGVIIISMLIGLLLNFTDLDPIKALIYSAVINGIVSPLVLIPIVQMSSSKKIMGSFTNKPLASAVGWFTIVIMILASVATLASLLF
jgi:NRAMP (natural resistance-associated macrophage protein)-like metal ion transporter